MPATTMATPSGQEATPLPCHEQRQVGAQQAEAEKDGRQQKGEREHSVLVTTLLHQVRPESNRNQHENGVGNEQ